MLFSIRLFVICLNYWLHTFRAQLLDCMLLSGLLSVCNVRFFAISSSEQWMAT